MSIEILLAMLLVVILTVINRCIYINKDIPGFMMVMLTITINLFTWQGFILLINYLQDMFYRVNPNVISSIIYVSRGTNNWIVITINF